MEHTAVFGSYAEHAYYIIILCVYANQVSAQYVTQRREGAADAQVVMEASA